MTRWLIRADGGATIGLGHLTRCRALTRAFVRHGVQISWITATPGAMPDDLTGLIDIRPLDSNGNEADQILALAREIQASGLVGDWQNTNSCLVDTLRARGLPVALLGNQTGSAQCDLLIRQRFEAEPDSAPSLDGADVLLLDEVFSETVERSIPQRAARLLVSLGGSRSDRVTAIHRLAADLGQRFGLTIDRLQPAPDQPPHTPREVAARYRAADLAVLAGGTSLHEAVACGLPLICLPIAPRQKDRANSLASLGLALTLDPDETSWEARFETMLERLVEDHTARSRMAIKGMALVDGLGADRVAQALLEHFPSPAKFGEST